MKSILVIEDDRNFSHLLCQFLRNNNFHVIEAVNPDIGSFLIQDRYPDLVICSLESLAFNATICPTVRDIRDTFSNVNIPWILLTAETSIFDLSGKLLLSEVTIIKKPVALNVILEIVQRETNQFGKNNTPDKTRSGLNHPIF